MTHLADQVFGFNLNPFGQIPLGDGIKIRYQQVEWRYYRLLDDLVAEVEKNFSYEDQRQSYHRTYTDDE